MATHGSLTKAGKVRGQTPKVEGRKIVGTNSSLRNKSNFKKRRNTKRKKEGEENDRTRRCRKKRFDEKREKGKTE